MTVTQTVIVRIRIVGGEAVASLDALTPPISRATQQMSLFERQAQRFFSFAQSQAMTLVKALVSMVGVLIAFNLFVTIPERIASALAGLALAAVRSADEVQRSILATAGLIATFVDFGPNIAESFIGAHVAAQRLYVTFTQLAAKSLATAADIQMGFQAFVARGGMAYVKSLDDAARATTILVSATLALTGGIQKERQIRTEIDALMAGQARAGAVVARLLRAQVGDLSAYLEKMRTTKGLVEDLEKRFGGLVEAGERQSRTVTGMINSIKGLIEILNLLAMQQGGLRPLLAILERVRDALVLALKELTSTGPMSESTRRIVEAFALLSISIEMVVSRTQALTIAISGGKDELGAFSNIARTVNAAVIAVGSAMEWAAVRTDILRAVLQAWARGDLARIGTLMAASATASFPIIFKKNWEDAKSSIEETIEAIRKALQEPFAPPTFKPYVDPEEEERRLKRIQALWDRLREMAERAALELVIADRVAKTTFVSLREAGESTSKVLNAQIDALNRLVDTYKDLTETGTAVAQAEVQISRLFEETVRAAELARVPFKDYILILNTFKIVAAEIRAQAPFKDLITQTRQQIDQTSILSNEVNRLARDFEFARSHGLRFQDLAASLEEAMRNLRFQIEENRDRTLDLRVAIEQASGSIRTQLIEQLRQLEAQIARDEDLIRRLKAELQDMPTILRMLEQAAEEVLQSFARGIAGFRDMLMAVGTLLVVAFIQNIGQLLSEIFLAAFQGDKIMTVVKRFFGQLLMQVGSLCVMLGMAALIFGQIPFLSFLSNPWAAAALIAVGVGMIAAGAALTASARGATAGGGGAGGGQAGTESRTIYLTPMSRQFQTQSAMLEKVSASLDTFSDTLERFNTKSPGVLVIEGLPRAASAIVSLTERKLQQSPEARMSYSRTVLQEA